MIAKTGSRRVARAPRAPAVPSGAPVPRSPAAASPGTASTASGRVVLAIADNHLGEPYILGARAPMSDPGWKGPWDCAEFASWCVYHASGVLFGVSPRDDPVQADAFSGFWLDQAIAAGAVITVEEAASIPGAVVVRAPLTGRTGHVVLSDGAGGTIEAHSAAKGVLRVTEPMMAGTRVAEVQQRLKELGFFPGPADGIYGPQTESAVQLFQASQGLVPDGEVGALTWKALKPGRGE